MSRAQPPAAIAHKIGGTLNGFRARASLFKAMAHPGIVEVEGEGMEEGRVFLHAATGYKFNDGGPVSSRSVGSARDLRDAMATLYPFTDADEAAREAGRFDTWPPRGR